MAQTHVLESTASTKDPWKELVSDGRVRQWKKAFAAPPMACLKRGPNLKDKLVRARLPPRLGKPAGLRLPVNQKPGFTSFKAGRMSCSLCGICGPASDRKTAVASIFIAHSGLKIPILQPITCRDTFCQYLLSCRKTGYMKQY